MLRSQKLFILLLRSFFSRFFSFRNLDSFHFHIINENESCELQAKHAKRAPLKSGFAFQLNNFLQTLRYTD